MPRGRRSSARLERHGRNEHIDVGRASDIPEAEEEKPNDSSPMTVTAASVNRVSLRKRVAATVATTSLPETEDHERKLSVLDERKLAMMGERMFQHPLSSADDQAMAAFERQTSVVDTAGAKLNFVSPQADDDVASQALESSTTGSVLERDRSSANAVASRPRNVRATRALLESYMSSTHFPVLVHRMMNQIGLKDARIAHWSEKGTHFWINRNSTALSEVLKVYFKHENYDSLRRQLNAYQFSKVTSGAYVSESTSLPFAPGCLEGARQNTHVLFGFPGASLRGYWHHPFFSTDSSYETLKRVQPVTRGKRKAVCDSPEQCKRTAPDPGPKGKENSPDMDFGSLAKAVDDDVSMTLSVATSNQAHDTPTGKSGTVMDPSSCPSRRSTEVTSTHKNADHSFKDKERSVEQDESVALSQMEFSIDDIDDIEEDEAPGLTSLGIAAACVRQSPSKTSIHRVPTFSPISITETEYKAVTMVLSTGAANLFEPTPIKAVYPDLSGVFGTSPLPSLHNGETVSGQSERLSMGSAVGSFGSPLRTSEKSAFTAVEPADHAFTPIPVADMKRRTSPEYYEPFVGFTRTLFAAVGVPNADFDASSSTSISSLGDHSGSSPRLSTCDTDLHSFPSVVGTSGFVASTSDSTEA